MLTFKTQRPLSRPWAHARVARALGVWSESFWALKRSTATAGAPGVLSLPLPDALGHLQRCRRESALPCIPLSLWSHPPPRGRVRLIRIYGTVSTTVGCFTLSLILWQFSGSESYICMTGGQERWEAASALRAGTEDQRSVMGTPRIQSSDSFFSYISSGEGDCCRSCLVGFGDAKASCVYATFTPMHVLIRCLIWPSWGVKEMQRTGLLLLTYFNRETKAWRDLIFCPVAYSQWQSRICHWAHDPSPLLPGELQRCSLALRNALEPACPQNPPERDCGGLTKAGTPTPREQLVISRALTVTCPEVSRTKQLFLFSNCLEIESKEKSSFVTVLPRYSNPDYRNPHSAREARLLVRMFSQTSRSPSPCQAGRKT